MMWSIVEDMFRGRLAVCSPYIDGTVPAQLDVRLDRKACASTLTSVACCLSLRIGKTVKTQDRKID